MKRKIKKKIKKKTKRKTLKRKRSNSSGGRYKRPKALGFKFQTLIKAFENFKNKQKTEKLKQDKLKSKEREKQIKEKQRGLKEELCI